MARKPNYGLNRSDVNRAKQARQNEKQRAHEEAVAHRRAAREGAGSADPATPTMPEMEDSK